ncbi:von Willebrand factor type A [Candidatus Accumulibacter aalborgensis]|uniref:von Willebrand factor type A n=1 Tax=Candidatus Accumulibacter aalborgensis TaxID=1860102 RepID=A0A1A8XH58_9PROT|nr:VWA domain-containing protein [Candidatus Accumulibacter aalborgensis]SBT03707.1 von Willebrand factor type A [Candidatus Accumulibacter aalborgensis]
MANTTPRILIQPLKVALITGVAQKLPVLIRVQAPDPVSTEKKARKPYHLALVIDRSGSMSGPPLAEAVRCAKHITDQLAPTDIASLIVFDDRVQTLVLARPVGDRKALYHALSRVHSGGSTNLYGGWQAGAQSLLPAAGEAALARVILLSDGNANVGEITDTAGIATLCAQAAERGVSTSTYGLGADFNEDLMVEMAKLGGGNHYYGDTAADLFEPFAQEFDFISALCARQVRLSLAAAPGVSIRLLNDYPVDGDAGMPVIRLPDIAFGAEAWALVELEIPSSLAIEGTGQLLQAAVTASTPDGEPLAFADALLTLPAMPASAWAILLADPLVVTRQAELAASKLLERARAAAEHGDWATVERLLAEARQLFADQPWVIEVLESIAELARSRDAARFRKEALYSSRFMHTRISPTEESSYEGPVTELGSSSFLRRKTAQGKAEFDKPDETKK